MHFRVPIPAVPGKPRKTESISEITGKLSFRTPIHSKAPSNKNRGSTLLSSLSSHAPPALNELNNSIINKLKRSCLARVRLECRKTHTLSAGELGSAPAHARALVSRAATRENGQHRAPAAKIYPANIERGSRFTQGVFRCSLS